jgi:ABC-type uncharacterized transport system permease subunit
MDRVSVVCFLASYLVAFVLEWTRLLRSSSLRRIAVLVFAAAGFIAHTGYLLYRSRAAELPPLLSSGYDWILVLAWTTVLVYLFITAFDRDLAVGLFLLPLVLLLIVSTYFVDDRPKVQMDPTWGWAMLHASFLVFGMVGIILGIVLSMMYLIQHRRLKHKHAVHEGLSMPSLERLARWNWWAIVVSVPLLMLGLLSGIGLAVVLQRGAVPLVSDPMIIGNTLVWLLMVGFLVWLLKTPRSAGRQVAWLTIWACGFLLVTLISLQVLTTGGVHGAATSTAAFADGRWVGNTVERDFVGKPMSGGRRLDDCEQIPGFPLLTSLHPQPNHDPFQVFSGDFNGMGREGGR